jgi:hypothetical protein
MGNRLKMARQLAQSNNMAFREDYVKRFNSKVSPHEFKEGMLVYLHRPDMVKVNPKLQSPWFGPFVILAMIGDHNCLIQELSNKKTKFVNVNRLRAYNNSIAEWNNFKLTLDQNKKGKIADMQKPDENIKCTANADADATAPRFAEFERDNDVVILNPEVVPIPKTIKVELEEGPKSVTTELSEQEDDIPEPTASTASQSKSPSLAKTLHQFVLPSKKKTLVPTERITRKKAQDSGNPLQDVEKSKQDLEKLRKRKPKSK